MAPENYAATMRQVREVGDARGIASDLSATVRRLDLLDRREVLRAKDAPALAAMILDHEAARRLLATARVMKDERYAYWKSEVEILGREIDQRLRKYLQTVPDATLLTRGPTAWARQVIRRAKAEAAGGGRTPTTRTSGKCRKCGKQSGSLSKPALLCGPCSVEANTRRPAPAKGKTASRAGTCSNCRKVKDYILTAGICQDCLYVVYPKLRR